MAPFRRCPILKYFVMICVKVYIIHAAPKADIDECLGQIFDTFGNSNSSTGCFRYAVEHYIKQDFFPNTYRDPAFTKNISTIIGSSKNVPIQSQNVDSKNRRTSKPHIRVRSFEELMSSEQTVVSTEEQMSCGQTSQPQKCSNPPKRVRNFEELMSGLQADQRQNVSNVTSGEYSNESMLSNNRTDNNITHIYDDSSENEVYNDHAELDFTIEEYSFEDLSPGVLTDEYQNVSSENKNKTNYAVLYYKELENMVQGSCVNRPSHFCKTEYNETYYDQCTNALEMFGSTSKEAVGVALTMYRLSECHDQYVIEYMQYLINNIKIISPSKRPVRFCNDFFKKNLQSFYN